MFARLVIVRLLAACVCASPLTACSHLGGGSAPFVGRWVATRAMPGTPLTAQETFDFRPDGTGTMSVDAGAVGFPVDHRSNPFRWNPDGHSVNVSYAAQADHPAQTDPLAWSLSDNGAELTLTEDGTPTVFQKSP